MIQKPQWIFSYQRKRLNQYRVRILLNFGHSYKKNQNFFLFQSLIHDFTFNKIIFEILLKLSFFCVKSAISIGALLGLTPYIKYEVDDPVGIRQFAKFQDKQTYNYIVIGGGTTGSVIASRLSENPYNRVLLLEAGGDGTLLSDIGKSIF